MSKANKVLGDPTATIETATWHGQPEILQKQVAPGLSAPISVTQHCEIIGRLEQRKGLNGQTYAVRYHLRLPTQWNGKFFFQGGGGSNGELGDAMGRVGSDGSNALGLGYAVVSQDSGHDNAINSDPAFNGAVAFGFDPRARRNYGHTSLKLVADTAKTLIAGYYGRKPQYSYFVGCSKGGQEGITFALFYPDEFDGIVAAAPGFALPRAAVAEAWDVQNFAALLPASEHSGDLSGLYKTFSAADFDLVRSAILGACDKDDGLVDGMVGDIYKCTDEKVLHQLSQVTCSGEKTAACVTPSQVTALTRVLTGAKSGSGRSLYASWFWPSGIAGDAWRMWKIGSADGRVPPLNVVLGGSSLAAVFTTPPTALADTAAIAQYQMHFDFDRDAPRIYSVSAPFLTSAWHDVGSRSPDLSAFRAHGGRLIVPHGESDPVFSLKDTLAWFDEVDAETHGRAATFVRVFPVPGMCHCGGGQATDNYDAFGALVAWVEKGAAPASLFGTAGPGSPWPGRQRPICAYPKVARYISGNTEAASSFECRA
ncbi:tannase/feruloyl esterase family alpha/beta hydrolase [Asticcacaulis benevestitus]|uniref:Feruloyl esterase n=1 Tax=Asticcacaulis benevestitus DSM 16100 = ATCC BAA-896 TaxID=1121022 RepID=V4PAU7_9CAUL|nr:tannase/feruloyl esterase family alpha/beta hydrolase [Asticcacaulis benevestitus]ESQ91032.1 hypothetical protein ABENE_11310 [Asticcacaulis benevestitus DSM 16100 = ATCC BAA-896]